MEPETTESLDEKDVDKTANATYATTTTVTQSMPDPIVSTWKGPKFWKFLTISPVARGIMLRGLVQPFALMRLPIVIWCGVMYGIYQVYFNCEYSSRAEQIADVAVISGLTAGIFAVAPYGYSTSKIGLTYLGPMFGTIPGYASSPVHIVHIISNSTNRVERSSEVFSRTSSPSTEPAETTVYPSQRINCGCLYSPEYFAPLVC